MNIHKDIRLALAALLVLFAATPLATAVSQLVGYDNFAGEIARYLFSAVFLLAAAVGLTVAYHLYRRAQETYEESYEDDEYEYEEEDGDGYEEGT